MGYCAIRWRNLTCAACLCYNSRQYRCRTCGPLGGRTLSWGSMTAGLTTVLAKLDSLIAAISKESGFLEKVLS
jgi:hypothetical protein